jgi:hypothetical protein
MYCAFFALVGFIFVNISAWNLRIGVPYIYLYQIV